uniref:5-formyltetrahydrofolate cyclo-ligase n=1 Tax=Cacopsylla melanoneura TaxID=428564 RepID=A0A8D9BQP0_9HEMI
MWTSRFFCVFLICIVFELNISEYSASQKVRKKSRKMSKRQYIFRRSQTNLKSLHDSPLKLDVALKGEKNKPVAGRKDPSLLKIALRQQVDNLVSNMTQKRQKEESDIVHELLLEHPFYKNSTRIGIFMGKADEIRTKKIIKDICNDNKQCFIPWIRPPDGPEDKPLMTFLKLDYEDIKKFSRDRDKVYVRLFPAMSTDAFKYSGKGLDLVIVPGRAFTRDGKRLGRGDTMWSKFLTYFLKKKYPNCKTLGLALSCQIVTDMPMDKHSVKVDDVIYADPEELR